MTTLALRTDKPEAEIYLYDGRQEIGAVKWAAHLKLAETINAKIETLLNKTGISYDDIRGVIVFKGPGSFTGLRIGMSVANALAYGQDIPIVATAGEHWIVNGLRSLDQGGNDKVATPEYGSPANLTEPRK